MGPLNINEFKDWMRSHTSLQEGSILLYARTISRFDDEYGGNEVTEESLNCFVADSFRGKNSGYAKYAFKYYLEWLGMPELYKKIVKVRSNPRRKLGTFLPEGTINKLILNIADDKYKDIATLQFATGARARGILTLRAENIDMDYSPDVIRLRFIEKGGKEKVSFLDRSYEAVLKKYMKGSTGYMFIPESENMETCIATHRSYYFIQLNRSALSMGLAKFGTHDFRRNVAELLRKKYHDIFLIKKVLGHSRIETTVKYFSESPEDAREAIIGHQRVIHNA